MGWKGESDENEDMEREKMDRVVERILNDWSVCLGYGLVWMYEVVKKMPELASFLYISRRRGPSHTLDSYNCFFTS